MKENLYISLVPWILLVTSCGDDNGGSSDTVLTGFSGVIIFGIVAWVIYAQVKKRRS